MAFDLSQYVGEPKISDGAWGTQLASAGLPAGACTESWNLDNPSAVERAVFGQLARWHLLGTYTQ